MHFTLETTHFSQGGIPNRTVREFTFFSDECMLRKNKIPSLMHVILSGKSE
jgi:hypothetical protein